MPKITFTVEGWLCSRCGHKWVPRYYYSADRSMVPPKVCPKCKSPYWDTPPKRRRPTSADHDPGAGSC